MRAVRRLASVAAALTLVVVAASATIRIGGDALGASVAVARGVHRFAASAAALAVLALAWRAVRLKTRLPAAGAALALMLALSAVGWATGTRPPPLAALFNQLGGMALAALLAWIAAAPIASRVTAREAEKLARIALALASLQVAYAAAMPLLAMPVSPALLVAHAVLGLAAAAVAAALGIRLVLGANAALGAIALACASAAPSLGVVATLAPQWSALPIVHAAVAALLLTLLAHVEGSLRGSA